MPIFSIDSLERGTPQKDFRLMHQAAFQSIEQWRLIRHPNIVSVHEAFTTRSFGDNCPFLVPLPVSFSQSCPALVVAYTYHPNAQTLYDAHIKPRAPTFVQGRLQAAQPHVPERTLWSYIIQIAGAMKAAHDQGLPVRMIDVSKVIVTGRNRVRISSCGLADVLTYSPAAPPRVPGVPIPAEQIQEDLVMFGKLIMALCCNNVVATNNFGKSLDVVTQHYSADLKNVALFCLSKPGAHKVTCSYASIGDY
jgi:PAB-dependent poly(A)-specific ribonuclease subunit 3